MAPPGYYRFSPFRWLAWQVGRLIVAFFRGLRDTATWFVRSAKDEFFSRKPGPVLTLLLISLPIAALAVVGPPEWVLNWPVVFAGSLVLVLLLKVPLALAPLFLRKVVKIAIAVCLLQGFVMFLDWEPFKTAFGLTRRETFGPVLGAIVIWFVAVVWIVLSRPKAAGIGISGSQGQPRLFGSSPRRLRFSDVGGMEEAKEQIRQLVQSRLQPDKYLRYGVVRNGILLHGPRGSGKTFLAEATAGEFGLSYYYLSPTEQVSMWRGQTAANLRDNFANAAAQSPALLFIDEIDTVGGVRQATGTTGDPGGAGRAYNTTTTQLMQSIDQYRDCPAFVLMAATNFLDGLDPALIREGRFDLNPHFSRVYWRKAVLHGITEFPHSSYGQERTAFNHDRV